MSDAPVVGSRSPSFGLRTRVILAFVLGSLLVSGLLSAIAFTLTRNNLLDAREGSGIRIAGNNAASVSAQLNIEDVAPQEILIGLSTPLSSLATLRLGNEWTAADPLRFGDTDVDTVLLEVVSAGEPSRMRYRVGNTLFLVVGIPLPDRDALYFEAVPLSDIDDTLRSLGLALGGGAFVSVIAAALLGSWVARRALLPLDGIGQAAEAIAAGELDTRLESESDLDLGRLTASFNRMAGSLEKRIERDGRFASEVSHELRSPLMTLTASMEVLNNQRDEMPERAKTALDLLSTDLRRFHQLVEDLLEISRFDVGVADLQASTFQLSVFVKQAVAVTGEDVPVVYDPEIEGLLINADKRRLARVIDNLLDNARKYAGGAVEVQIAAQDNDVSIVVGDEGPGVPETERTAIFERFSRGVEGGRRGAGTGVGLGLALVSEHVRLHHGSVTAEPWPDRRSGTRFVVRLPGVVR